MKNKNSSWNTEKIISKLLLFIIFFSAISTFVNAIGITPARSLINFESNIEAKGSFNIINNEEKTMKVTLHVNGDLSQYIRLSQLIIELSPEEKSKQIDFILKLPQEIQEPGIHDINIIAQEIPIEAEKQGAFIVATIGLQTQIRILVPYPGKYIEANLDVYEANVNEEVSFVTSVKNIGKEDISEAGAVIEIRGPTNELIDKIESQEESISPQHRKDLLAYWTPTNPGSYHAAAIVNYDGKILTVEKTFDVGGSYIDIKEIFVKEYQIGDIAKFNIILENRAEKTIDNVYAEMIITDQTGKVISQFNSPAINLEPLKETVLLSYWDTEGLVSGIYSARLIIHYGSKQIEKDLTVELTLDSVKTSFRGTAKAVAIKKAEITKNAIFTIAIIVLVIINLAWFIFIRRRLKEPQT